MESTFIHSCDRQLERIVCIINQEDMEMLSEDDNLTRLIDRQERLMNAMEVDDVLMPIYMYE